jgi:neutral ceramidase
MRFSAVVIFTVVVFANLDPARGQTTSSSSASPPLTWKAGTATAVITPQESMWMAGYAARKKPSEGIARELYAKALALEVNDGAPFVLVTTDLIGIRRDVRDTVAERCRSDFALPPERLLLNASHTHCGPEYRSRAGREAEAEKYQEFLEQTFVRIVGEALAARQPATVGYARGRCGFAMNRRRNYALAPDDLNAARAPTYDGPVDHDVPVLTVRDQADKLRAVAFGYACHNTTLSSVTVPPAEPRYLFNGDYAGFAQERLQQAYPEAVAMFVNGCSGDQNPYPRRDEVPGLLPLELAEHHGRTSAYSVIAAMNTGARPINGAIRAAIGDVELTRNADKPSHAYPVQIVTFGDAVTLAALGSETTVDYALRLKRELKAPMVWVAGYSNDYAGYVPSRRVAVEGGYEAANDFTLDVEERIVGQVHALRRAIEPANR